MVDRVVVATLLTAARSSSGSHAHQVYSPEMLLLLLLRYPVSL